MKKLCEKHDAYYDDEKDIWLEGKCDGKDVSKKKAKKYVMDYGIEKKTSSKHSKEKVE